MYRSDPALIAACLAGKPRAWDELVERYGRLVYSIPRRYGLSDADSDDVFQSVFMALHRNLASLRNQTRLSAWLISTTHRECWRVGRRRGDYPELDEQIRDVSSPPDADVERWERQHQIQEGLKLLGGQCEALLRMLFLDSGDPGYDVIAEKLGMRVGSIGPTRARCFEKLQKILTDMGVRADEGES